MYDDGQSQNCKVCKYTCLSCLDEVRCSRCAGNRIGPDINHNCSCPANYLEEF